MPRILSAVLTTIVLLSAAPAASAKVITAMEVCGADRCVRVERAVAQRYHESGFGGPVLSRGVGATTHYRVTTYVGDGQGNPAAHRFVMAYSPRLEAVLSLDLRPTGPPFEWMVVSGDAERGMSRMTQGIAPFPGRQLAAGLAESANDSLPPETYRPAVAPSSESDGGLPKPLIAGAPVALLVGLGIAGRRRRR